MSLVALRSKAFPGQYLRLDATGFTISANNGGGVVNTQTFVDPYETFTLVRNVDGSVSFQSTAFVNAFLRLDGTAVPAGTLVENGGPIVNAQILAGPYEKFWIRKKASAPGTYSGTVGLESFQFPGRFLRMNGGQNQVNVQGVFEQYEEWEILVVG